MNDIHDQRWVSIYIPPTLASSLHPSLFHSQLIPRSYNQSHLPLHDQDTILGHSVRALYLTTAAADIGGEFLDDAKRLLADAIDHKMYVTGGLGTEPKVSRSVLTPLGI